MSDALRAQIISEIQRLAVAGRAPGVAAFRKSTGINDSRWRGILWARWSEAVADAGLQSNELQGKLDDSILLDHVISAARRYQRMPTYAELELHGRQSGSGPVRTTFENRFGSKAAMVEAIRAYATEHALNDVLALLPEPAPQALSKDTAPLREGSVYLLKSGQFYKIGRSDELECRVKEIRVALPDAVELVHSIRTDDPAGIEAYWHRRFADRRMNGEWFRLSNADVAAFRKRSFQ